MEAAVRALENKIVGGCGTAATARQHMVDVEYGALSVLSQATVAASSAVAPKDARARPAESPRDSRRTRTTQRHRQDLPELRHLDERLQFAAFDRRQAAIRVALEQGVQPIE